ncbi:hypothetical protein COT47_06310, partial [Candidatus Woesearchaeota archaeon CG08_land_8_20_14_0_20_43_7]
KRGYTVKQAFNGTEGIMLATSRCFDLIILDYMLPDIYGPDIARQIRQHDCDTFILGYSGHWDEMCRWHGLDDYAHYDLDVKLDSLNR